jgi:hypothetical protein
MKAHWTPTEIRGALTIVFPINPCSRRTVFGVSGDVKKKRELFPERPTASQGSFVLPNYNLNAPGRGGGISTRFLFAASLC